MALIIRTDGSIEKTNNTSTKNLHKLVGGYIEILRIPYLPGPDDEVQYMVVNDEGKLMNLPPNLKATLLALKAGYLDTIVGDVVLCSETEID